MIAFDTNVLIYSCDKANSSRQQTALDLIADSRDGVLLWQVACEFVVASRKLASQGFTAQHAWDRLGEFLILFPLVLPGPAVFEQARILHLQDGWSFWDAMIVSACVECGVHRLYSEDLPGREPPSPLQIVNPFE